MAPQMSGVGIGDWLTLAARRAPDRRCIVTPEGVATYADVERRATRLARALRQRGLGKADRIAVLSTDSREYFELAMASMKLGAALVPLNYRLSEAELGNLLRVARPAAMFVSTRYAPVLELVERVGDARPLRATLDGRLDGCAGFDELVEECDYVEMPSALADEDIAALALTSGTTGTPKGVMQSQRMLKATIISGVVELRFRSTDLLYAGPPMFHVSGLGHMLYGLAVGAASLILPQFDAPTVLRWLQTGGLTSCLFVPSMVDSLLALPDVADGDYSELRTIMYGGAPMPPVTTRKMLDIFDCDLFNGFGAGTEAGGQVMLRPDDHRRAMAGREELLSSIGTPQFGVDVRLVDTMGNDVPPGEVGEIITRSDSVMSGYFERPDLTARTVIDGWFHGGDMAYADEDGYLYLAGRNDDMIIRGGENVYPVEIEGILAEHPAIREVAVIGLPDAHLGEIVAAVVTVVAGAELSQEDLHLHCRGRLAGYKIPSRLVVVEALPRNPAGKVRKGVLKAELSDGQP